ncbi:FecR family protein [Aliirhizobium terrae]|uniref:FecR family protein n=1 Tax=Terrirhizobium terrae TaxID=2926709 RepID=UPI00257735BC|nr:FecR family protein [Rhizobium sp. CC-CFT758]WJH41921.1 FecR family protein [Rhizobium sp. CC-CFT758]
MQDDKVGQSEDRQEMIDEEAARWVVLLGGETVPDTDRRALQQWLDADPRHKAAFAEVSGTWQELGLMGQLGSIPQPNHKPTYQRAERPVRHIPPAPRSVAAGAPQRRKPAMLKHALALAACLVVAVTATVFWYGNPTVLLTANYRTAPGESRTITLSDGSIVDLGSDSALAVDFSDRERRVELLSGRAYFTAAPKAGPEVRPFVVASSIGTATAIGTQFSVDRIDEAVEVAVAEHSVSVGLDDGTKVSVMLNEGQSVRYAPESGLGVVETKNMDQATAWRRGKIIFSDVPLSRVIAELNRYRRGRIVIASDRLASLKVSGVFDTNDLPNALGRIVRELDLSMSSVPPLVTVIY